MPPMSPRERTELLAELVALGDDADVLMNAGVVRSLVQHSERPDGTSGARIRHEVRGVTYFVTIERADDAVHLRTVEVVPDEVPADPLVWRIPSRVLAETAAEVLALQGDNDGAIVGGVDAPDADRPPSAEELAELVRARVSRQAIAERYGRAVATVDQWLRVARQESPELFPARTRGPKPRPKTSDGN